MKSVDDHKPRLFVCIDASGYPVSLQAGKTYRRIPDALAEEDDLLRVVDDTGEDYLFPRSLFVSATESNGTAEPGQPG